MKRSLIHLGKRAKIFEIFLSVLLIFYSYSSKFRRIQCNRKSKIKLYKNFERVFFLEERSSFLYKVFFDYRQCYENLWRSSKNNFTSFHYPIERIPG